MQTDTDVMGDGWDVDIYQIHILSKIIFVFYSCKDAPDMVFVGSMNDEQK